MHNAWITTAGEKMSKSLGNSLLIPAVLERVRGIELRYYLVAAHYRSHVEFTFEALEEAAVGFRGSSGSSSGRPRRRRRGGRGGSRWRTLLPGFVDAMDDDLGTPAAVAVLHDQVREGNRILAGESDEAALGHVVQVRMMLDVLGLDPHDPAWPTVETPATQASPRRSTPSSAACSTSAPRRGRTRTSPPPTRSATRSRPRASRSRTPPPARSGH